MTDFTSFVQTPAPYALYGTPLTGNRYSASTYYMGVNYPAVPLGTRLLTLGAGEFKAVIPAFPVIPAPYVPPTARPVFVGLRSSATSGTLAVDLPSGWVIGSLAILSVVSQSAITTPLGWVAIGSEITNALGKSVLFYRVLQGGDVGPILSSGVSVSAIVLLFAKDTFNPTTPVAQIQTHNSAAGVSVTHMITASSSVTAGGHYLLHIDAWNGTFATVSSYPYTFAQHSRGMGSTPNFTGHLTSGVPFDGGVSISSSYVVSTSTDWIARKLVVIGRGFTQ